MYLQDAPGFLRIECHIIMQRGLSGIYMYVKTTNTGINPITFGLIRIVYRFNPRVMHKATNGVLEGILPLESELNNSPVIQDTTWKLPDGTIYSKYDYAGYIRNTPYQGVFGNGYGAWLLSASREYHSGGPLKQDLLVHQEALILNCMTAGHFGTPPLTAPPGWTKIYGPWLLYFNQGSEDELKANAISQSKVEQSRWPYNWMTDTDYPLKRGSLTGQITGPPRSMVVLSSSLIEEFDMQTLGYSYSTESDQNGYYMLKNIRPGSYKLTAYPVAGFGIGVKSEKLITITEGSNKANLDLLVPKDVKWSIGETNRRSDSYRHSNEKRNYIWHTLPPANLEFQIGKSKVETDWYYAQTKKGTWSIRYNDTPDGKNRILRIGLAAASNNSLGRPILVVSINGRAIEEFHYGNDQSIYRSASQSGNFYAAIVNIPANLVVSGDNVIGLTLRHGSVMYDSVNLSVS